MKICLVIIFNHNLGRFNEEIIEKLKKIYKGRFSCIKFLMPFYTGCDKDVIPVYENSYQFQGYVTQGYKDYYEDAFDGYLFCADDVLLNPHISERKLPDEMGSGKAGCFVPTITPVNRENGFEWAHVLFMPAAFVSRGCEWQGALPTADTAKQRMNRFFTEKYGKPWKYPMRWEENFFKKDGRKIPQKDREEFLNRNRGNQVRYPLVYGYSDLFLIGRETIGSFAYTCGVFAAMNLFVEMAVPTAALLTCDSVKTLTDKGMNLGCFWSGEEGELMKKYDGRIELLMEDFPENLLLYHPVKLSGWN